MISLNQAHHHVSMINPLPPVTVSLDKALGLVCAEDVYAAAGLNGVVCYPSPKVAIAATGSELIWPGEPVTPGKVAASNMVTAAAELKTFGINASTILIRDSRTCRAGKLDPVSVQHGEI